MDAKRKNQILLFAAAYFRANRDEAAESFGVSPNGWGAVEGSLLHFPSFEEMDEIIEELAMCAWRTYERFL